MAKYWCIVAVVLGLVVNGWAQEAPGVYWIGFADKANTPYSFNRPTEFLSQRALDRRTRQGIALDERDLPVDPEYIRQVLQQGNVELMMRSKWMNAITIRSTDTTALIAIGNLPFVTEGPTFESFKRSGTAVADKFAQQGENDFTEVVDVTDGILAYGSSTNQVKMLETDFLHNLGFTGEGMSIAVIDQGFVGVDSSPAFARLWDNDQIKGWYDFVDVDDEIFDGGGTHGTAVLSTIGGWVPDSLIGTAPDADFWLFRTEANAYELRLEEAAWISAAEFADSVGVDVINTSLGYSQYQADWQSYTYDDMDGNTTRITQGADIAATRGMVLVTSAGNSGERAWRYIIAPADADNVLAVGAVFWNEKPVGFTSRGPSADGRVKPNVAARGYDVWTATANGLSAIHGTSFASPLTAGSAACLWQAFPESSYDLVVEAIERSADRYLNPDTLVGHGIPDFHTAHDFLRDITQNENDVLRAFPNPFAGELRMRLLSQDDQDITIELIDVMGRVVFQEDRTAYKGWNELMIQPELYRAGTYILQITTPDDRMQLPIVQVSRP